MFSGRTGWRKQEHGKPSTRSCRPALEQLENRVAPAVYHVNTFQDTTAANLATGQDVAGHVSLRSALSSANANGDPNTIILGTGIYDAQTGVLDVHGNLQIIGQGPGHTVIDARHLEQLFAVEGGSLELNGLTLDGGPAETLLKGDVLLTNSQITDTDIAAVVAALMAGKAAEPVTEIPATNTPTNINKAPAFSPIPAGPVHLVGPAGGGGTADHFQDATQDPHQAFWRVDAEPAQEKPDLTDDLKPGPVPDPEVSPNSLPPNSYVTPPRETVTPAETEPKTEVSVHAVKELWITRVVQQGGTGQAFLLLLVVSVKDMRGGRAWANHKLDSWHHPPRESRRTRGPPASGPPFTKIKIKIQQSRQRCLLCSFFIRCRRSRRQRDAGGQKLRWLPLAHRFQRTRAAVVGPGRWRSWPTCLA